MNLSSVLGKDWISKNYSEETVNFLKDNFSLSEILSRLIAIRNIKIDKVTVWDGGNASGDGSSATSNFVSSLVQSLPPIHDVAKMAGVDLPDYLGSINELSDDS